MKSSSPSVPRSRPRFSLAADIAEEEGMAVSRSVNVRNQIM